MNKKILNRILIEWNDSGIEDNGIIKSSDVKHKFDAKFVYFHPGGNTHINIFNSDWPLFNEYRNKVYLNGELIELDYIGNTISDFNPGLYEIYIENLEKIDNCNSMFCVTDLYECPLWNTSKISDFHCMFSECRCKNLPVFNLSSALDISYMCSDGFWVTIPMLDVTNVINMGDMFSGCQSLQTVPMFKGINPSKQNFDFMFWDCESLTPETEKLWKIDIDGTPCL